MYHHINYNGLNILKYKTYQLPGHVVSTEYMDCFKTILANTYNNTYLKL